MGVTGEKEGIFYRLEQKMTVQNIVVVCGGDLCYGEIAGCEEKGLYFH